MFKSFKSFILISLLISLPAFAVGNIETFITKGVQTGIYSVGIGSQVNLKTEDPSLDGPAIFLGSSVLPDGTNSYQLYLNIESKKVFYIAPEYFASLNFQKNQKVLDSYEQTGGTCSAYAINNFLHQTNLSGFQGTGELNKIVSTEEGRIYLLADAINEYYLTLSHRYSLRGILDKYGKKFGFKCNKFQTDVFEKASKHILNQLKNGLPVIVSYNIGPKMVHAPFALDVYDHQEIKLDDRLWIPRRVGERNSGGHTIVATASFTAFDKTYLVMVDSDWSEPRIWDMDEFLNHEKTALEEIEFITCK